MDGTGNVGVGTESPSVYGKFTVAQTTNSSSGGLAVLDSTAAESAKLWCDETTAYLSSGNAGDKLLALNVGGGNVGIGTDSPTVYSDFTGITIDGTAGSNLTLRRGGTVVGDIFTERDQNILSIVAPQADGKIEFHTAGYINNAMTIGAGGDITMSAGRLHIGVTGTSADVSDYQYVGFGSVNSRLGGS